MPAQTEPHLTLTRAARATEDARLAAGSARRLTLPAYHRGLVLAAVNHLDAAQGKLFEAANLPLDTDPGTLAPRRRYPQLSMELAA